MMFDSSGGVILHIAGERASSVPSEPVDEEVTEEEEYDIWWEKYMNKGDLSNVLTFTAMIVGFILLK